MNAVKRAWVVRGERGSTERVTNGIPPLGDGSRYVFCLVQSPWRGYDGRGNKERKKGRKRWSFKTPSNESWHTGAYTLRQKAVRPIGSKERKIKEGRKEGNETIKQSIHFKESAWTSDRTRGWTKERNVRTNERKRAYAQKRKGKERMYVQDHKKRTTSPTNQQPQKQAIRKPEVVTKEKSTKKGKKAKEDQAIWDRERGGRCWYMYNLIQFFFFFIVRGQRKAKAKQSKAKKVQSPRKTRATTTGNQKGEGGKGLKGNQKTQRRYTSIRPILQHKRRRGSWVCWW